MNTIENVSQKNSREDTIRQLVDIFLESMPAIIGDAGVIQSVTQEEGNDDLAPIRMVSSFKKTPGSFYTILDTLNALQKIELIDNVNFDLKAAREHDYSNGPFQFLDHTLELEDDALILTSKLKTQTLLDTLVLLNALDLGSGISSLHDTRPPSISFYLAEQAQTIPTGVSKIVESELENLTSAFMDLSQGRVNVRQGKERELQIIDSTLPKLPSFVISTNFRKVPKTTTQDFLSLLRASFGRAAVNDESDTKVRVIGNPAFLVTQLSALGRLGFLKRAAPQA